ncbi:MAG: tyrosine-type recombinase/integrase, partial [Nitrospirota bacterium]
RTKSGMVQYVRMVEETKQILRSLIPGNTSVWVFPSENPATHMDTNNFYGRVYRTALKDAKLEGVTWHTLRHTFASRLAMSGQNPSTIAALLRHSGTDLVARYAHLSPTHLQGALEGVSEFGKGQRETIRVTAAVRAEGQNSIPTVTGTGTASVEEHTQEMQVAETMGQE